MLEATGHAFNLCGCTDVFGFEGSAKAPFLFFQSRYAGSDACEAVINMYDIKFGSKFEKSRDVSNVTLRFFDIATLRV